MVLIPMRIIEVVQIDDNSNSTVLFKGIITDVQLKAVRYILYYGGRGFLYI